MRRSSVNPFAFKNSILENIEEETEQVTNNPFQSLGGFKNKLSVSSQESEGMQNPFMKINKKTTNPFEANANPFQANANPFQTNTNTNSNSNPFQAPKEEEKDEVVEGLFQKLSLKIEVKDKGKNVSQNMVFLEESQKREILKILKPFLTSEMNDPNAEMVMKINSRKNSVERVKSLVQTEVQEILEESEPSEKESKIENQILNLPEQDMKQEVPESNLVIHKKVQHKPITSVQQTEIKVQSSPVVNQFQPIQSRQQAPQIQQVPQIQQNYQNHQIQQNQQNHQVYQNKQNFEIPQVPQNQTISQNYQNHQIPQTTQYSQFTQVTQQIPVQTAQYSQTKIIEQPSHHVENFQYSRPITNKPVEIQPRIIPTEIKEQNNYQYIPQAKPPIQYEMSPNYQANFANPNFKKTKDFRLQSVIRSITTTKRPSQLRETFSRESFPESVTNQFQPNLEESSQFLNTQQNSQLFVEGHSSYIKLQSNKFQDSQMLRDPTEMEYASNLNANYASHLINDGYTMQTNPMDSLNQTQEIPVQNIPKKEEQKIEFTTLVQKNKLETTHSNNFDSNGRTSERLISKKFQSSDPNKKQKMPTYSTHQTQIDSSFAERMTHDPSSIPVNRNNLLGSLRSKPVKRSFTNGLRIFRKVKDSQGNIVKQNMEHSINIYSSKILKNLKSKKETQDTEDGTRNYKTLLYTSSTLNPTANSRGLVSDRVISSQKNDNQPMLYTSTRNIEERNNLSNSRSGNDNKLATSIFYSGTKTEQNSARNSNLKTHYVRSTRVSPAITIGSRTHGVYSKFFFS